MDSLVASAARSLAAGDPLGALERVALRDDPPALAPPGNAMAQLDAAVDAPPSLAARAELIRAAVAAGIPTLVNCDRPGRARPVGAVGAPHPSRRGSPGPPR